MSNIQAVVPKLHFTPPLLPSTNLLAIPLLQAPFYTSVLPCSENCSAFYQSLQPTTLIPTTKPPLQRPLPFNLLTGLHAFHGWKQFPYGTKETRDHNLSNYSTDYFPILLIRPWYRQIPAFSLPSAPLKELALATSAALCGKCTRRQHFPPSAFPALRFPNDRQRLGAHCDAFHISFLYPRQWRQRGVWTCQTSLCTVAWGLLLDTE